MNVVYAAIRPTVVGFYVSEAGRPVPIQLASPISVTARFRTIAVALGRFYLRPEATSREGDLHGVPGADLS